MANSADSDQLASSEANWSGSTLFAKQDISGFSRTRVNTKMTLYDHFSIWSVYSCLYATGYPRWLSRMHIRPVIRRSQVWSLPGPATFFRGYWSWNISMAFSPFTDSWRAVVFVCVEVLRPSQPNWVMSSVVSLPNHTFTGQA